MIKEGFLCPVCLEDFPGINDLQAHFTSGIHDEKPGDEDGDAVSLPLTQALATTVACLFPSISRVSLPSGQPDT